MDPLPKKYDDFRLSFKDVGADRYGIEVNLCNQYNDDGMNPCLDGVYYLIEKSKDEFIVESDDDIYPLEVKSENGVIRLKSGFSLVFEDNVQYKVTATLAKYTVGMPNFYAVSEDFKKY